MASAGSRDSTSSTALVPSTSANSLNTTVASPNPRTSVGRRHSSQGAPSSPTPSTPISSVKKHGLVPAGAAGETGRWMHPRMAEVIRRQNATNFDNTNVQSIALNVVMLLVSLLVPTAVHSSFVFLAFEIDRSRILNTRFRLPKAWTLTIRPYSTYAVLAVQLLFLANIGIALLPLMRKADPCHDIPLTPSQRRLMGLPPMSRPATPQEKEQYVTPPRFSRSATPTSSLRGEASDSPMSGRGTPTEGSFTGSGPLHTRAGSGSLSPFGPGLRSGGERRRLSYQSNHSPLSISEFDTIGTTPTPTKAVKASVGLNNKWLYEKGRASPRGTLGAGSRNSVFL